MSQSPSYATTVLNDQPAAYWRCNSSTTFADTAGHVAVGTVFAGTLSAGLLAGDTDFGLSFNGTTTRVNVPSSSTLSFATAFTFEAWVRPSQVSGTQSIFIKPSEYELYTAGSSFNLNLISSSSNVVTSFGPTLTSGSLYHVAYSFNGYSEFGVVNGATYSFGVSPVNPPPVDTGSAGFTIGGGGRLPFFGTIDDVALYSYKLSEQQLFAHYIAGATATPGTSSAVVEIAFLGNATEDYYQQVTQDSPLCYYRLNESSGTTFNPTALTTIGTVTIPPLNSVGGVTLSASGPLTNDTTDTAVQLDGSTGYLVMPSNSAIDNVGASGAHWALEAWVYPTAARHNVAGIISKEFTGANIPFVLGYGNCSTDGIGGVDVDSSPFVGFFNGSWHMAENAAALDLNTWVHLAGVWDGTYLSLYKNGVLVGLNAPGVSPGVTAGCQTFVGHRWDSSHGTSDFFPGRIDEPAIYGLGLGISSGNVNDADRIGIHYAAKLNQRPITWTDISPYVRGYSVSGGRQHELDRYEATTLSVTVNNDDRRFEADYTGGAYYPNVLPYRRIRVWEQKDGVRFPIFHGWIERWPQQWVNQSYHSEVEIQAVDGFDIVNSAHSVDSNDYISGGAAEILGTDIWAQTALYFGANWDQTNYPFIRKFNSGVSSVRFTDTNVSVLSVIQDYEATEQGEFYFDRFGRPTYLSRGYRTGSPVLATFGDAAGEVPYTNLVPSLDRDNILNRVTVTSSSATAVAQTATDWDSVARYGPREFSFTSKDADDIGSATTATSILNSHKTASRRFESIDMLYADGGSNALLVQLLTRQVGDRITVKRRPDKTNLSSVMTEDCLISHVQIRRSPKRLEMTWQLIPAP